MQMSAKTKMLSTLIMKTSKLSSGKSSNVYKFNQIYNINTTEFNENLADLAQTKVASVKLDLEWRPIFSC